MTNSTEWHTAFGKIILFGEHAVVYGAKAIAASIPDAVQARVEESAQGPRIHIPAWGLERNLAEAPENDVLAGVLRVIHEGLDLASASYTLDVRANIPVASGLGASAALAVASIRALSAYFGRRMSHAQVNALAYECEKLAHGQPSGLDNTLATYGGLLEFQRRDTQVCFEALPGIRAFSLLVVLSGKKGFTAEAVARVKAQRDQHRQKIDALFDTVERARLAGLRAMEQADFHELGRNFSVNQACLRALGVSCDEIEQIIDIAEVNGALGAKLTGSGDGGAVLVLAGRSTKNIQKKLKDAGFESLIVTVTSTDSVSA